MAVWLCCRAGSSAEGPAQAGALGPGQLDQVHQGQGPAPALGSQPPQIPGCALPMFPTACPVSFIPALPGTFWDKGSLLWGWREVQVPPLQWASQLIRFVFFGGQELVRLRGTGWFFLLNNINNCKKTSKLFIQQCEMAHQHLTYTLSTRDIHTATFLDKVTVKYINTMIYLKF